MAWGCAYLQVHAAPCRSHLIMKEVGRIRRLVLIMIIRPGPGRHPVIPGDDRDPVIWRRQVKVNTSLH